MWASIIAGVVAVVSSLAGVYSSSQAKKKERYAQKWNAAFALQEERDRYKQQLEDQRKNWKMQNKYNSPENQMNLYRQAGLNSNLIYGKGAEATAGSINSANYGNVEQVNPGNFGFDTSQLSAATNSLQTMYNLRQTQAQTDNTTQNTALMAEEMLYKQSQTAKTLQDTARSKFDLSQAQELKDSVIMQAKLNTEKQRADIAYTLDENQRKKLQSTQDIKLAIEKIITEKIAHAKDQKQIEMLQSQLNSVQQDTNIRTYEQKLTEMGIHKNDPWYFRGMMNLVNGNISVPTWLSPPPKRPTPEQHRNGERGSSW